MSHKPEADDHQPEAGEGASDCAQNNPPTVRRVPLGGDQIARLAAALGAAFTLDQLNQMMLTGLEGNLSLRLDAVVAVQGRNGRDICHDRVLWALRDEWVSLHGLLAAALRSNPGNPEWNELHGEWAGVVFTAPACPYPGMKPFTAAEQGRFYGRAAEIKQAVERLRRLPLLAVVGASGSGKSSLLMAGIVPALEKSHYFADRRWDVRSMRPGAAPYDTLVKLLDLHAPPVAPAGAQAESGQPAPEPGLSVAEGTRLLLVVDQFEELFTTAAEQRQRFEQTLLSLTGAPDFYLTVAARADFYANLMASPLWPRIPPENRLEINPPRGDALAEAIALPAKSVGVELQPQLVERMPAKSRACCPLCKKPWCGCGHMPTAW